MSTMYVVSVIPFVRGTQIETLSYFAGTAFVPGSIITITIRNKQVQGLVTACDPAQHAKSSVKSAHFTLRKLPEQVDVTVLPETIIATATKLTELYPASMGSILYQLIPPPVRNGTKPYPRSDSYITHTPADTHVLTATYDDRLRHYQSHIREQFAHRGSVVLVVPTTAAIADFATTLGHGIEERVICLSGNNTTRAQATALERFADVSMARLIITTPSYAYLDRVDITSIIVEEAASGHYKTRTKPYLDHRVALKTYASIGGRQLLFADTVPLVEHEYQRRADVFNTADSEVKRIALPGKLTIINQADKPSIEAPFQLYATKTVSRIRRILEGRGRVFLFGARRGLAPVVVCVDCGHIFRCPDSHTPYSLLRTNHHGTEARWFVSTTSGRRVRAADTCPQCGSWRLRERGIGIQHAYDEWRSIMPEYPTILFDTTTASTQKRAQQLIDEFYATDAAVLVGTTMALPYLTKPVTSSVVVSYDATRTIPSWRADEATFRLLLRLREQSDTDVLVQTRTEPDSILEYAASGSLERFYDDELTLREQLSYPPFRTLMLLTWVVSKHTAALETLLQAELSTCTPRFYPNPHNSGPRELRHCLCKLSAGDQLARALTVARRLPPYVKIEMNPDRIV